MQRWPTYAGSGGNESQAAMFASILWAYQAHMLVPTHARMSLVTFGLYTVHGYAGQASPASRAASGACPSFPAF